MLITSIFCMHEVCECKCVHAMEYMWKSENKFQDSALSFSSVYQTLNSGHQSTLYVASNFSALITHLCVILYLLVFPDTSVFMNLEILVPKKAIVQEGMKIVTRINWEIRLFLDESGLSHSAPTRKKETLLFCHGD